MTNLNEVFDPEYNYNFTGDLPLSMSFNAGASTPSAAGGTLLYEWDFGDGNTAANSFFSHTYKTEGFHRVTLTVTDEDTDLSDTSQAFVRTTEFYDRHQPTIGFTYPESSLPELNLALEEEIDLETQALVTIRDQYPYVVYLNPEETPIRNRDISFLIRHSGVPCTASNPEVAHAVYVNGGIRLAADRSSYWTLRNSGTQLCNLMLFPSTYSPELGALISAKAEAEIRVLTNLQDFHYNIDNIAGVRVPRVFVSILPDSMIPGDMASPHLKEYTTTIGGKEELMLLVNVRNSEAQDFVEFEVPVYAVDKEGRLAGDANGYFNASFPNTESDCGDCVMVDGVSYVKVKAPLNVAVGQKVEFDLEQLSITRAGECNITTPPPDLKVKTYLNGCITLDISTSNAVPLDPPPIESFAYELTPAAWASGDSITFGAQAGEIDGVWNWFNDLNYPAVWGFAESFIPIYSDILDLLQQVQMGLSGEDVDWFIVGISLSGLALDLTPGGFTLSRVANTLKATYKASAKTSKRLLSSILDNAGNASLLTKRSPGNFVNDLRTREPDLYNLISTSCGFSSGNVSLTTQATKTRKSRADCIKIAQDFEVEIITGFGVSPADASRRANDAIKLAKTSGLNGDTFLRAFDNVSKKGLSTKDFLKTWEGIADVKGAGSVVKTMSTNSDGSLDFFRELEHGHILRKRGSTVDEFPNQNFKVENGQVIPVEGTPVGSVEVDLISRNNVGIQYFDDVKTSVPRADKIKQAEKLRNVAVLSGATPRWVILKEALTNKEIRDVRRRFCPILDVVTGAGISICD